MRERIQIKGFKSISKLELELGRVTVLVGANGSGKSNILEAIAFAAGACGWKLDNEFLISRGIRTTDPRFMPSQFEKESDSQIEVGAELRDGSEIGFTFMSVLDEGYPSWTAFPSRISLKDVTGEEVKTESLNEILPIFANIESVDPSVELSSDEKDKIARRILVGLLKETQKNKQSLLASYLIFAPELATLRGLEREGQVLPLGTSGEGLLRLLQTISREEGGQRWRDIHQTLQLLDWFSGFEVRDNGHSTEDKIAIEDRFLAEGRRFDQRVANEGFLFLLFYAALFTAKQTPGIFAVDNIDSSLNPRTCSRLMARLVELAVKYDKQVILTTHNPALLDGLNLHDDEQRLYATSRTRDGRTKVTRVGPPESVGGEPPVRLSEAFARGLIGGLPQNF